MKPEKTIQKLLNGEPVKIAALGDSLTYGWMVRKGYLDFLLEMLSGKYPDAEVTIINRGIPGDTASGGLLRVHDDVTDGNPDLSLVQFALNDAFTGYSPGEFRGNILKIVEEILNNSNSEIALVTSVCLKGSDENDYANRFYSQLIEIAEEMNLSLVRVHEYWRRKIDEGVEFRSLVQADLVHPTVEGYRLMAEAVMGIF